MRAGHRPHRHGHQQVEAGVLMELIDQGSGEVLGIGQNESPVDNRAQNGRSTKTFISEGRWQAIVDALKKGDWVFVQFGHNDESKEKGERYTPPDQFRTNIIRFIEDVKAKKANIILLTPVMRRKFDKDGNFVDQHPAGLAVEFDRHRYLVI